MRLQSRIWIWVGFFAVSVLALWVFRGILLPFIVGMALAYLLDPVADQLERWRFSRFWSTAVILFITVVIMVTALLLIVPLVVQQVYGLVENLPGYVTQLQQLANERLPEIYARLGDERAAQLQEFLSSATGTAISISGNLLAQVMQSGLTLINALGLMVVTPVVAFYLLLDWDGMVKQVDKLLPRDHKDEIRQVLKDIDAAMSGVIRGQVSVVLLLALFYATSLSLSGLSFGLAIGLLAGFFSFVPYVGFLIGFVLSMGVATFQFWPNWYMIAIIFVIFMVGQFLEGNILYPKLVGSSIGVHPVWLMFALFAFGLIFGFVGLLLAVPMAAIASVLVRFAVRKYEESSLYSGAGNDDGGQTPKA